MSREIKFRAWDEKLKIMFQPECSGLVIHFDGELNSLDENYEIVGTDGTRQLELMQFTELKDTNNKEIYEGDIVKVEDYVAVIKWDIETCRFVLNIHGEHLVYDFDNFYGKELEVIGNIYENPELLGESHEP